jgi:hypothetical protein
MNKDKIKGFAIGTLTTLFLLSSSAVFAAPVSKQISAVYNNIKLVVNGNAVTPKDADGVDVEPFIYNGTTYLPVRAVSDALGQLVEWDGKTSTVYIGKKPEGTATPLTSIAYARLKSDTALAIDKFSDKTFIVAGKKYFKGISFSNSYSHNNNAEIVYNTNSMYKKLTGIFGIDDNGKDYGSKVASLTIIGDGKELFASDPTHPGDIVDVNVDITNINQVTIQFKYQDYINPSFVDPQFY